MNQSQVPLWIARLHDARQRGQVPAKRWVLLSTMREPLAKRVPWLQIPQHYRPTDRDNLSALTGLDIELAIDDQTPCGLVLGLMNAVLASNPRRLMVQTFGKNPTMIIVKKGGSPCIPVK